jgi:tyrosinase
VMSANRVVDSMPTQLRFRPSVEKLSADQVNSLKQSIGAMAQLADDRGFQYFARLHGGPPRAYCKHGYSDQWHQYHGAPLFLPWHRAYLHFFELAMQDRVPGVMLAWWNWTSPSSHQSGIPSSYEGSDNPLARQPIAQGFPRPDKVPAETWRAPGSPAHLPSAKTLKTVLGRNSFMDFSTQLEQQLHNLVHGWAGGAMAAVPIAAFDPIFYAHHCMVDRIWRLWQLQHGQPGPPPGSNNIVLEPFPLKVGDVLDVHNLGYDYAGAIASAPGTS